MNSLVDMNIGGAALRNLSLFTGSGIGDLAAANAGITTVAQVENDPCCMYCLEKLWTNTIKFKDVYDVSNESLRERGCLPIDIISGGFPCQPVSTSGRGAGEADARWLWPEMLRIISEVRPIWVVIENSPRLRLLGGDTVLSDLEAEDYTTWPLRMGACDFGSPQERYRWWVVAHTNCVGCQRLLWGQPHRNGMRSISDSTSGSMPSAWSTGPGKVSSIPCYVDGLARGLLPKTRSSLLRMVGNGWFYQIPELIYRWISQETVVADSCICQGGM